MTHICAGKLSIIGSDNDLSPGRRQAIIWTNAGMLLIGPLGTNFSEILIEILTFFIQENAFESVVCEMVAILSRPQCVNGKCLMSTFCAEVSRSHTAMSWNEDQGTRRLSLHVACKGLTWRHAAGIVTLVMTTRVTCHIGGGGGGWLFMVWCVIDHKYHYN